MDFYSDYTAHETLSSVIQGTKVFTDLSELVCQLGKIGVSGPRHFSNPSLNARGRLVGRGAQFEVFELTSGIEPDIVVKRVRLDVLPGTAPPDARSHLRTLQLEIASLCDPARRSNRNIVDLVTWGYDYPSPNLNLRVPILCMEKAISALGEFLQHNDLEANNAAIPYHLCLDISAGLQGIHSTGIVHGDLKSANVLVFKQDDDNVPFIAKLSDFGKCIEMNVQVKSFAFYSGTQGWRPPESIADYSEPVDDFRPGLLFKCDSYAYGLLAISVLMFRGEVVQGQELIGTDLFLSRSQSRFAHLPDCAKACIKKVMSLFLQHHPEDRSDVSPDMIECTGTDFTDWQNSRQNLPQDLGDTPNHDTFTNYRYYSNLDTALLAQLEMQLSDQTRTLEDYSSELVFGMAIGTLAQKGPRYRERAASYFEAAAKQSNLAARAIFKRVQAAAQSNGTLIGLDVDISEWLFEGASTGSFIAMQDLHFDCPELARIARHKFVELGGFNKDISSAVRDRVSRLGRVMDCADNLNKAVDDHGNRPLHYAASYGPVSLVELFIEKGAFVDEQNHLGETALYKACQAANVGSVKVLVSSGADVSLVSSPFGISCLHWLFNFDTSDIKDIAQLLVSQGAQVNALTQRSRVNRRTQQIPAGHFPFYWPHGAPIHWAAFAGSFTAIDALLDLGAPVDSPSAVVPANAQTALVMAARRGDSAIVKHLLLQGANPNLQDRLQFTPVHAMVNRYVFSDELSAWPDAFRWWIYHGSWQDHVEELTKCAQALADGGCDLNAWRPLPGSDEYFTNPIIDAAENRIAGAVLGLLKAGAAADCVRPYERDTPLHIWASRNSHSMPYVEAFSTVWEALLGRKPGLNIHDVYGTSLWHQAIRCGNVNDFRYVANSLVHAQPPLSLEHADLHGRTPLLDAAGFKTHISAQPDAVIWADLLLDLGADITANDYDNRDFVFLLCMNSALSDSSCLHLIQKALLGLPVESQRDLVRRSISCTAEQTPFMWACHNSFIQVVKFFLALDIDVNAISKTHGTALDFALDSSEQIRRRYLTNWVFDGKLLFDGQTLVFPDLDAHTDTLKSPAALLTDTQAVTTLFQQTITEAEVRNKLVEDGHADAHRYFACMEVVKILLSVGARSVTALIPNLGRYTPYIPTRFDRTFVEELELGSDADRILAEMQPFYEEHWRLLYSLRS